MAVRRDHGDRGAERPLLVTLRPMGARTEDPHVIKLTAEIRAALVPLSRALHTRHGNFAPTELSVIGTISRNQPITIGDLATLEHLSVARISRIVSALADRGIVVREFDPSDRRLCPVRMSATGSRWLRRGRAERNAGLLERLQNLEPEEIQLLMEAMPVLEKVAPSVPD